MAREREREERVTHRDRDMDASDTKRDTQQRAAPELVATVPNSDCLCTRGERVVDGRDHLIHTATPHRVVATAPSKGYTQYT